MTPVRHERTFEACHEMSGLGRKRTGRFGGADAGNRTSAGRHQVRCRGPWSGRPRRSPERKGPGGFIDRDDRHDRERPVMADYDLYSWPVPFRGQFVRAVLASAAKTWTEGDAAATTRLIAGPVKHMLIPFMGPPLLVDKKADFAIAEMPAIVLYLGETLNLMPSTPALRAMTMK